VESLYPAIAHGDLAHQTWLAEKLKEHFGDDL
jgi:hypothetical protein